MAIKKKPKVLSDELEYRLSDYRAREEYVSTSSAVDLVIGSRWKLAEKVRLAAGASESDEAKTALMFAQKIVVDEIQALAFLKAALTKLEEPYIAALISLKEKVEQLEEKLERVDSRVDDCSSGRSDGGY